HHIFARQAQCSNRLCLRYRFTGHGDLHRQDFCNPRRNTWHLRMDVGNRTEPELHATNPTGESDADPDTYSYPNAHADTHALHGEMRADAAAEAAPDARAEAMI